MRDYQAIENRLLILAKEGRLEADAVVRDAEDEDSPLHEVFEWDDKVAAHAYRVEQARSLIRTITIDVTYERHVLVVPAYVRDPKADPKEQGYVSTAVIRTDKEQARRVMKHEMDRARGILARAHGVAVTLQLDEEIDALVQSITSLQVRAEATA